MPVEETPRGRERLGRHLAGLATHVWAATRTSFIAAFVTLFVLAINMVAQWETLVGFLFPEAVAKSLSFPRPSALPDWPPTVWLSLVFVSAVVAFAEGSYKLSKAAAAKAVDEVAAVRAELATTRSMLHKGAVFQCGLRAGSDTIFLIVRNVGNEKIDVRAFLEPRVVKLEEDGLFFDQSVRWPDPIRDVMELVPGAEHRALLAFGQYRTSERRWVIVGSAAEIPGRWVPQTAEHVMDQVIRLKVVSTAGHSVQEICLLRSGRAGINNCEPVPGDSDTLFPVTSAIAPRA